MDFHKKNGPKNHSDKKIPSDKNRPSKKSSSPPLNLSLDFPQIVHEDELEADDGPPVKSSAHSSKNKKTAKRRGLLDSGVLDVGGLGNS